ncbi:hypothetical protein, partial [Corynebacterium striatum]
HVQKVIGLLAQKATGLRVQKAHGHNRVSTMWVFAIGLATLALAGVIGSRVWMLKHIKNAQDRGERPFDQEDELRNPYI